MDTWTSTGVHQEIFQQKKGNDSAGEGGIQGGDVLMVGGILTDWLWR